MKPQPERAPNRSRCLRFAGHGAEIEQALNEHRKKVAMRALDDAQSKALDHSAEKEKSPNSVTLSVATDEEFKMFILNQAPPSSELDHRLCNADGTPS